MTRAVRTGPRYLGQTAPMPGPAAHHHRVVLVRHGETGWSASGRHTGRTDVPLTAEGERRAAALVGRLPVDRSATVLTSPLARAADTARLAGFDTVERCDDLLEWDYGEAEGLTTAEIREERPGWDVWTGEVRGGETVADVGARADRVIARCRALDGDAVLVGHGHLMRVLGVRWLGLSADHGRGFLLDAAHWAVLGWERETPAVVSWNVGP